MSYLGMKESKGLLWYVVCRKRKNTNANNAITTKYMIKKVPVAICDVECVNRNSCILSVSFTLTFK